MDKKLVLAVAGSGKTYYLCQTLVENEKNLILAFTHENIKNISNEIIKRFGYIPDKTCILTFSAFLYRYILFPYVFSITKAFDSNKSIFGVETSASPKPRINGRFNPKYKRKEYIEHYISKDNKFYCDLMSELALSIKDGDYTIAEKALKKLNCFFDRVLIDEVQGYRNSDYDFLIKMFKCIDNIITVGDYYQHSVSGLNNTGRPFSRGQGTRKRDITYDDYICNIEAEGITVDIDTLCSSRRCGAAICDLIFKKLSIPINSANLADSEIINVDATSLKSILDNDRIIKLVYSRASHYIFNAMNWSYSKGSTYEEVCIILTNTYDNILDDSFSLPNNVSTISKNVFYVALSRAKLKLYILKNDLFRTIENEYLKPEYKDT